MRKLQANAFEIGFPQGWSDNSTVTIIGPARSAFAPNVQVNQESLPQGMTAAQYFAEQRAEMVRELDSCTIIEQGERALGGERCEFHSYTWKVPQGFIIRQSQHAVVRSATLYTVTCSAMESEWAGVDAAFDRMLAGFAWR